MSHSWIRRFSVVPAVIAGIAIGRNQVCAVVLDAKEGNHQLRTINVHDMPEPIFTDQPIAESEEKLADALHAVSEEFRSEFAAVRVALPDTVIRSTVFDLDELPKTGDMRDALLRWRFAKLWQQPEESLDCRGFDLGEDCGKRLYLGQAGDRSWLDCVRRSLTRVGIVPWSLNAAVVYRFNCFHDAIAGGGALLSLDPDCWNLQIWDAAGRVRRVLTRLRENEAPKYEAATIADEVERAILAYVQGGSACKVDSLHLAGNDTEMALLASAFNGRLREGAVLLRMDERISGSVAGMGEGLAPLALAAALNT